MVKEILFELMQCEIQVIISQTYELVKGILCTFAFVLLR